MGNRGRRPSERDEPALIELVMLEPGSVPGNALPAARLGGRRSPGPRSPRLGPLWAAVALVAALSIVIVVVARDDGDAQPAAVPASTLVPATVAAPSISATSIPATSIAPSTAPATTASGPITTAPVSLGPGPVLGVAHGWTLVSFDQATLKLLDLDSGKTDTANYDIRRFGVPIQSAIMLSDRFVYTEHSGAPSVWSQRFRDEPQTMVLNDATIITSSSSPGRFWVALNQEGLNGEQLVAEADSTGRRWNTVAIPKGLRVVGSSAAGLWLTGSGRIFAINREGVLQQVAVGTVIDASSTGVLFDDCVVSGPCTLRLASASGTLQQSVRVGPSADIRVARPNNSSDSALSPNGRWLLLADGAIDRRTSGPISHDFVLQSWRWSPDSEWLFAWTANAGTIAWNLSDGRKIPLGNFALSGIVVR